MYCIEELKENHHIESRFVHSDPDIEGTVQKLTFDEIVDNKINLIGVCNMLARGFDIPYISATLILSTSPKMDKKSVAAPTSKRSIQTFGRQARFDSGIKGAKGLDDVRDILTDLGINLGIENEFNNKIGEYVKTNLEVQSFLLRSDKSDTSSYVIEKVYR